MPRSLLQVDLDLARAEAEIARLRTLNVELGTRVKALENTIAAGPTVAQSLAVIARAIDPLATHAGKILAVQAGSMGVGK